MGWVHHFDLADLQKRFGLDVFLETGVGNGDGIMAAQKYPFKRIISIEIMPEQVKSDNIDEDLRLPLEKELFLIKDLRGGKDVVLFDDLKIYRFQGRDCWRGDICPRRRFTSDEFYKEILSKTHDCVLDDSDTGYCQLTPKL